MEELQRALAALCEKMTGAFVMARVSRIVLVETWERSINIPNLFNSLITAFPKSDKPLLLNLNSSSFGSSFTFESALKKINYLI